MISGLRSRLVVQLLGDVARNQDQQFSLCFNQLDSLRYLPFNAQCRRWACKSFLFMICDSISQLCHLRFIVRSTTAGVCGGARLFRMGWINAEAD